jgi:prepilin-type N-terminal cleavage/methylation domain-containing protein
MNRARCDAGFTLLEMLVALCVLGLLTMAIARGLHLGAFSWTRAQHDADAAKQMRQARRLLQDVIGGAYPAFASANLQDHRIAFAGTPDAMALITRRPAVLGTPVMIAARLFFDEQTKTLALAWRLDLPGAEERTALVAGQVAKMRLAYENGAGWQDHWEQQNFLPAAIRVSVEGWPPLVIATHATAATACLFDPTDIECARTP